MSKVVEYALPCPFPDCGSSDAYHLYDDGHGYCFSCSRSTFPHKERHMEEAKPKEEYRYDFRPWRSISPKTMEFYGVTTSINGANEEVELNFPFSNGAIQSRGFKEKKFRITGPINEAQLFGQDKFNAGSARAVTITEGLGDALAVYEMMGDFPAVGVRSAATALKECKKSFDFLNSFEKIYLAFDNDAPGNEAKSKVASLFDFNKIYDVQLTSFKDPHEFLENGKIKEYRSAWFNAKRFLPEGIISSFAEFSGILGEKSREAACSYPFDTLNQMTYGIRWGEVNLFTALEGIGKTEIFRAIEHHILKNTDDNIGIIHLEEGKKRILQGIANYELELPVHLPDCPVGDGEVEKALQNAIRRDDRVHIYSHFGSDDPDVILNTIRFLVAVAGCKYIFLDHITMVVSGLDSDDERRALDKLSTKLAMMVEELDFTLFIISHVNDEGLTRGSRNISKIADLHVHMERNKEAEEMELRNTTFLTIRKNRFCGNTGPSSVLRFDMGSYILKEKERELPF